MKKIHIVRHCKAKGQEEKAELTLEGIQQAEELKSFMQSYPIDQIISSPFKRAIDSIHPLSVHTSIPIEVDPRLSERILAAEDIPDWQHHLKQSFTDFDAVLKGGESSRDATERVLSLVKEVIASSYQCTVLVTHGNLMSLLLKAFDEGFGYEEWRLLSNPDVYQLSIEEDKNRVQRIWK